MLKLIFPIIIVTAFLGGGVLFIGLNLYSNFILLPKMKKKGIIDNQEAFWYFTMMTPIPALRDYLQTHEDQEFSVIYGRLHQLSKLVVWLIGGSLFLVIIGNIIENI